MSFSQHRVRFAEPLREARVRTGRETFVSESSVQAQMDAKYRSGYEAGQKALSEELVRQRTQLLEIQNNVLRSLERTLPSLAAQCERDLIALAMTAARRAVHETPISAELVEATLRAALAEIQGSTEYQVRLNPEDYALLQSVQSPALNALGSGKVSFAADPRLARAGCAIETRHGSIELNRETMLKKLEAAAL